MPKTVLVTGAYQGIGRGIADALKGAGYTVIYSDVHPAMAGEHYCRCDISRAGDRAALRDWIEENFGRLDLLVNNAGVACQIRFDVLETTEESFDPGGGHQHQGHFLFVPALCQLYDRLPGQGARRLQPPHCQHCLEFQLYLQYLPGRILHF